MVCSRPRADWERASELTLDPRGSPRRFEYPRVALLIPSYVLAVIIAPYPEPMVKMGHPGVLTLGFLYAYASTTGITTSTLLAIAKEFDPISEGAIAGTDGPLGDLLPSCLTRGWLGDELPKLAGHLPN